MPKIVLSQPLIAGLAPGEYLDLALPNFGVRVRDRRAYYFVRVRERGRRVRVTLGAATGAGSLLLKKARADAADKLRQHDEGKILRPPVVAAEALAAGAFDAETITIPQLCEAFIEEWGTVKQWSRSHRANAEFFTRRIVIPAWGNQLAKTLTRQQAKRLVYTYAKQAPVAANRLQSFLSKLCRWAVKEEYLDANPIAQMEKPTVEQSRERTLLPAEIVTLWKALDAVEADEEATAKDLAMAALWRLRLLTAQREQSLRRLEWTAVHLDEKVIEIPGAIMKGRKGQKRPHVVPLGPLALAILERRKAVASPLDKFVFGTRPGSARPPVPPRGVPVALKDFRGHDLRRTAATLMAAHGITSYVIARVLAHKDQSVTGIYNRYEYLAEKRTALELLDRVVAGILDPKLKPAATLLTFAR
jgi:integrase